LFFSYWAGYFTIPYTYECFHGEWQAVSFTTKAIAAALPN
jgi:hypothetical protein